MGSYTTRDYCKMSSADQCHFHSDPMILFEGRRENKITVYIVGEWWRAFVCSLYIFCLVIELFSRISGCGSKSLDCLVSVLHVYLPQSSCIFATASIELDFFHVSLPIQLRSTRSQFILKGNLIRVRLLQQK